MKESFAGYAPLDLTGGLTERNKRLKNLELSVDRLMSSPDFCRFAKELFSLQDVDEVYLSDSAFSIAINSGRRSLAKNIRDTFFTKAQLRVIEDFNLDE